jgi:hypothetical protein
MKKLSFGEDGEFVCYSVAEIEEASVAIVKGEKVMVARPCSTCGDLLFGSSLDPNLNVECEEGNHGSRPGVWV